MSLCSIFFNIFFLYAIDYQKVFLRLYGCMQSCVCFCDSLYNWCRSLFFFYRLLLSVCLFFFFIIFQQIPATFFFLFFFTENHCGFICLISIYGFLSAKNRKQLLLAAKGRKKWTKMKEKWKIKMEKKIGNISLLL